MMRVTVKLFASLRKNRFVAEEREYPANCLVGDVVNDLKIREGEIGIILINGLAADLSTPLREGDVLSLFPLVGGG